MFEMLCCSFLHLQCGGGLLLEIVETQSHEEATIRVYTDGSKYQGGVESGVVIYRERNIIARQKVNLEKRCSNNQAEQVAIHKALEEIDLLNRDGISPLTAIIYTDSRISLDSLHKPKNHSFHVEEIRKKVASIERKKWSVKFSWVKSHAKTRSNEIADKLAKKAARRGGTEYEYARIPKKLCIKKPENQLGKNGKESGQKAKKLQQPGNTFPQFKTD